MRVIGLMSGTSADGIDAVLTEIVVSSGVPQMRQLGFESVPWPQRDRELIERLIAGRGATRDVSRAGFQLGEQFASAALRVADSSGLAIDEIDLIGSHGQTVWHEVEESGAVQSTLQIGEAAVIAERTGVTTVADFRVTDVAAGGQGAPLIPIFDRLFLRPPAAMGGCRAVQNIGGIGNVSFLPPERSSAPTVAFDTGPGNVLIDWAAARATDGALQFDRDGELAASGRCADKLVERWLTHPYYHHSPPKSTGRELFSSSLAEKYCLEAAEAGLSMTDFAATVTELTAASIAESYRLFAPMPVVEMVVCGGGARNPVLLHRIKALADLRCGREVALVRYGDVAGVPGDEDSKEALGFALLAWLAVRGEGGNVPESTGANGVRVLGKITPGRNYRRLKTIL
ncbi:MAG: anhydro-N-acetylmuramic acid kinase [Caldilineaceae bacterium]|nr:anhydro-N-acetylmuramic acid kinase [Caldilineaceae bacterium]